MAQVKRDVSKVIQELIFESLKREDARLNELSAEALTVLGTNIMHTLVGEVLASRRRNYRLRLLNIIAEIGHIPDPADHMDLFTLAHDVDPRIRAAAASTIYAVGPHSDRKHATPQEATAS
jgi:hypothetical protein